MDVCVTGGPPASNHLGPQSQRERLDAVRISRPGSREMGVRIEVDAVQAFNPEIVVVAPCGFGLADAERLARGLPHFGAADVRAVDANAYFARPGPRYVDGVAVLGDLFQG